MDRESVKIIQGKLDVQSLIAQLNAALAEEWLAYYQYWVGAFVVEGAMLSLIHILHQNNHILSIHIEHQPLHLHYDAAQMYCDNQHNLP